MSDCRIPGGARAGTAESPVTESAHWGSLAHVAGPRSSLLVRPTSVADTPPVLIERCPMVITMSANSASPGGVAHTPPTPTSTTLTCLCLEMTDTGEDQRSRADPSGRLRRTDCPEMFRRLQGRACPLPPDWRHRCLATGRAEWRRSGIVSSTWLGRPALQLSGHWRIGSRSLSSLRTVATPGWLTGQGNRAGTARTYGSFCMRQ
jgi:hypothetical protein